MNESNELSRGVYRSNAGEEEYGSSDMYFIHPLAEANVGANWLGGSERIVVHANSCVGTGPFAIENYNLFLTVEQARALRTALDAALAKVPVEHPDGWAIIEGGTELPVS